MADAVLDAAAVVVPPARAESVPLQEWRLSAHRALRRFGAGLGVGVTTAALDRFAELHFVTEIYVFVLGFALAATLLLFGAVRAVMALVAMRRTNESVHWGWPVSVAIGPLLLGGFFSLVGYVVALVGTLGFARGRQLRRFGRIQLPEVAPGAAWAGAALPEDTRRLPRAPAAAPEGLDASLEGLDAALRARLAARWRENGRTEHASVAAFAQLTLDLLSLGAPPRLIADAQRDALDEIRHAELCFSLARALDGKAESPAPFPQARSGGRLLGNRTLALAQLAVGSLIDGALHEGLSARVIARLVKRCEEPATRAVLRELAADEGRHAAHGWEVVLWCLSEGGEPVARALEGALRALPSRLPGGAGDSSLEPWGLHGDALEAEEHTRAIADLRRRFGDTIRNSDQGLIV